MKSLAEKLISITEQQGMLFMAANVVVLLCTVILLLSVLFDFVAYHRPKESKRKTKSWVETGSMILYFFVYLFLLQTTSGRIITRPGFLATLLLLAGLFLVVAGCYVNIAGRMTLRHNWANQVTIYPDQTLVTGSVYRLVRHPLYASLIWMFTGGGLIYFNYFALLSVILVFMPMMFYRATQEEKLLVNEFAEYSEYVKRTGMLFPKINIHGKL